MTAAESTVFPNNVNGKLFGEIEIEESGKTKFKQFVCSASVVHSSKGNVIATAGHCVLDPETGAKINANTIFIPGYRVGMEKPPYGIFRAALFAVPTSWKETAKPGSRANEGSDVAFMELRDNSKGESVEEAVDNSYQIGFDQVCNQTYTQFGYPAESPYGGEILYSHLAAYAGADTTAGFAPVPMEIASDFTRGSSGGPWAVGIGSAAPTVLSVTAYGYESQPGYLYGPYLGEAAKKAYNLVGGLKIEAGVEESCAALPQVPVTSSPPSTSSPSPAPAPSPAPTPPPETHPEAATPTLKVTRVRRRANGSAVLIARVNTAGMLKLSGAAVRAESLNTPAAGQYRMIVASKGPTNRRLRQSGQAKVGVELDFLASGKTKSVSRKIQLSRPAAARSAQRRESRSHSATSPGGGARPR